MNFIFQKFCNAHEQNCLLFLSLTLPNFLVAHSLLYHSLIHDGFKIIQIRELLRSRMWLKAILFSKEPISVEYSLTSIKKMKRKSFNHWTEMAKCFISNINSPYLMVTDWSTILRQIESFVQDWKERMTWFINNGYYEHGNGEYHVCAGSVL